MAEGRGQCLRALVLPKDMDSLAGRCPAEWTLGDGAVLSRRYERDEELRFLRPPMRQSSLTALQLHLAFRTCSGPAGY
jgi:hypothetical protein